MKRKRSLLSYIHSVTKTCGPIRSFPTLLKLSNIHVDQNTYLCDLTDHRAPAVCPGAARGERDHPAFRKKNESLPRTPGKSTHQEYPELRRNVFSHRQSLFA